MLLPLAVELITMLSDVLEVEVYIYSLITRLMREAEYTPYHVIALCKYTRTHAIACACAI